MKQTIEFEKGDFNSLHDIIFDLIGEELTHDELKTIWDVLPEHLKEDAIHWGLNDSVVRDNIYVYLDENDAVLKHFDKRPKFNEDEFER